MRIPSQTKIYVISGVHSHERRKSIKAQMDLFCLEFEFIDACFPETFCVSSQVCSSTFAIPVNGKAEYGCAQSHQMAYQRLVDSAVDMAIVLEDDAELSSGFPNVVFALRQIDFDLCMLGQSKLTRDQYNNAKYYYPIYDARRVGDRWMGRSISPRYGNVGYAISNRGAKKLMRANSGCKLVADNWANFELAHGLVLEEIRPLVVFEDCLRYGSHIDDERGHCHVEQLSKENAKFRSRLYWLAKSLKGHLDLAVFLLRGSADRTRRSWKR